MCACTPEIKTPFCGRGDCQWPAQIPSAVGYAVLPHEFVLFVPDGHPWCGYVVKETPRGPARCRRFKEDPVHEQPAAVPSKAAIPYQDELGQRYAVEDMVKGLRSWAGELIAQGNTQREQRDRWMKRAEDAEAELRKCQDTGSIQARLAEEDFGDEEENKDRQVQHDRAHNILTAAGIPLGLLSERVEALYKDSHTAAGLCRITALREQRDDLQKNYDRVCQDLNSIFDATSYITRDLEDPEDIEDTIAEHVKYAVRVLQQRLTAAEQIEQKIPAPISAGWPGVDREPTA